MAAKSVRSIDRTIEILETIAGREVSLAELARQTNMSPSTVHRLIATLMRHEYVIQDDDTGRYLLGYKLVELAEGVRRRGAYLEAVARDVIAKLSQRLGESVNLAALDHGLPVYLAQADADRTMRMVTRVGHAVPLHSTAVGKAILAHLPPDRVEQFLGREPYPAETPSTITTADRLEQELRQVRSRGFAVEREEHEAGLVSVAAPVFSIGGGIVGAINASAPAGRVRRDDLLEWGPLVTAHAALVSARLGGPKEPAAVPSLRSA